MERTGLTMMAEVEKEVIAICKELGLQPDLQILKIKVMGISYQELMSSKDLKAYIKSCDLHNYDDLALKAHIESLDKDEKDVVKTRYGVGTDGLSKTYNETSERLNKDYQEVKALDKRAIAGLAEACEEYVANMNNARGF